MQRTAPKGTLLHNGSADCVGLFVVLDGVLRVFAQSEGGKEITLYRLLERDICLFSAACILSSCLLYTSITPSLFCAILRGRLFRLGADSFISLLVPRHLRQHLFELKGEKNDGKGHRQKVRHRLGLSLIHILISLAVGCDAGLSAVPAAAGSRGPVAQPVVPARDAQLLPVDEAIRNFKPGRFVHFGYGGSGNPHLPRALFMGLFFKVNQPDGFIFVHGQDNLFTV